MASRVVDRLEAVEVEHQETHRRLVPLRGRDRRGQPIEEQRAIRQACERIVECLVAQLGFGPMANAGVPKEPDAAVAVGRGSWRSRHVYIDQAAVAPPDLRVERTLAFAADRFGLAGYDEVGHRRGSREIV